LDYFRLDDYDDLEFHGFGVAAAAADTSRQVLRISDFQAP
jgi:hypothetical protein